MVGTAVQRLSDCNDLIINANGTTMSDDDITNTTVTVCDNEPVDIAVTLAMMVGVLMVSYYQRLYSTVLHVFAVFVWFVSK